MIRNPKAFEVWPACSCNAPYVITELGMLPFANHSYCFDLSAITVTEEVKIWRSLE